MNFILSTDTCADEFKSYFAENNIYYLPMRYICGEEEKEDLLNSPEEYKHFYDEQNAGKMFSTSAVNPEEFRNYFTKILEKEKKDVIHFCLSSGLSATYQNAALVAEEMNRTSKYKVYAVDSLSATMGMSLLVELALKYRNQGMAAQKAYEKSLDNVKRNDTSFFLTDLETLRRGGRISGAKAMIGKLVGIKPTLIIDKQGKLDVVGKVIGIKKAVQFLEDRLKNYDGVSPIFIVYAENGEMAEELQIRLSTKYPNTTVRKILIGPVICSHTGPSIIGISFLEKI